MTFSSVSRQSSEPRGCGLRAPDSEPHARGGALCSLRVEAHSWSNRSKATPRGRPCGVAAVDRLVGQASGHPVHLLFCPLCKDIPQEGKRVRPWLGACSLTDTAVLPVGGWFQSGGSSSWCPAPGGRWPVWAPAPARLPSLLGDLCCGPLGVGSCGPCDPGGPRLQKDIAGVSPVHACADCGARPFPHRGPSSWEPHPCLRRGPVGGKGQGEASVHGRWRRSLSKGRGGRTVPSPSLSEGGHAARAGGGLLATSWTPAPSVTDIS